MRTARRPDPDHNLRARAPGHEQNSEQQRNQPFLHFGSPVLL
jgi:hypothetical protein